MVHTKRIVLIALLGLGLPATLAAQYRSTAPAAQQQQRQATPAEQQMQQWVAELRQLNGKLEEIQAKAMQDAQLRSAQASLGEEIRAAMAKADPQLQMHLQRMQALETEGRRAQQAGDQAKFQQLAREAHGIQARLLQAQQTVFQQPAIAARMEAFQSRLEARMAQVDPQAPTLIRRFQELEGRLNAALAASQPPRSIPKPPR